MSEQKYTKDIEKFIKACENFQNSWLEILNCLTEDISKNHPLKATTVILYDEKIVENITPAMKSLNGTKAVMEMLRDDKELLKEWDNLSKEQKSTYFFIKSLQGISETKFTGK